MRERLAKIGFKYDLDSIDYATAEAFRIIGEELNKCEHDEIKRKRK
jgi:hypothetical protein